MTALIIIRHCETAWNVNEVFRGRLDIPLNEKGFTQADLLETYLADKKLEAIYSSPLQRARQTAAPLARSRRLEAYVEPKLIDLDFGTWQGLSLSEVEQRSGKLYQEWQEHPERVRFPGGEGLEEVRERASGLAADVMKKHEGNVVLVSHRVVNRVLICALLGLDNSHFWNIRQDNGGITVFQCKGGRSVLVSHNDTSYLRPLDNQGRSDF